MEQNTIASIEQKRHILRFELQIMITIKPINLLNWNQSPVIKIKQHICFVSSIGIIQL